MKKTILLTLAVSIIMTPHLAIADACDSRKANLSFYAAVIDSNKNVDCHYRYCYYGCITDSYSIRGPFRADSPQWENGRTCHSNYPYDCEFTRG